LQVSVDNRKERMVRLARFRMLDSLAKGGARQHHTSTRQPPKSLRIEIRRLGVVDNEGGGGLFGVSSEASCFHSHSSRSLLFRLPTFCFDLLHQIFHAHTVNPGASLIGIVA